MTDQTDPNFRAMRDTALHIVELLEGVEALAGQGGTYDTPIRALSLKAQELANGLAQEMKELI